MKSLKTALASLSLATLLMASSAHAATRSYESLPVAGVAVDRASAPLATSNALVNEEDEELELAALIFGSVTGFIAFLEAIGAINILGSDGGSGDSPG